MSLTPNRENHAHATSADGQDTHTPTTMAEAYELHDGKIASAVPTSTYAEPKLNHIDLDHTFEDHTFEDQEDMRRLGKKQELRRNFRFTSILGFVAIAMGTWEVTLSATAAGLTNGGTGGMIWTFVGSYICFGTIVLSLAEMSSMA